MSKPYEDWPMLMSRKDVKECTGLSAPRVTKLFNSPDFPLLDDSKREQIVHRVLLNQYLQKPRR